MEEFSLGPSYKKIDQTSKFECCLPNLDQLLPKLCKVIQAEYTHGEFKKTLANFQLSSQTQRYWRITGSSKVTVEIVLEKNQSHLIVRIFGKNTPFRLARELLLKSFMERSGAGSTSEKLLLSYGN